ncbi:helix-turn-helix transcriptional regulator [Nocardia sp. NPDC004340]|uniref:helix-turn-helix transcriptional regulator n=1 Tax=Nocardia sp. CA-136227 TaxID=3239979 RepID=UPI003D981059
MLETSARLLRLLSLLQTPREWSGADLAAQLEVDVRTVRRDIEKLRALGYPVDATPGSAGYRLGAGANVPPLLLDDEEAVAVAMGLRTAAGGTIAGIEESSLRALAKLERVLPSRLRHRLTALQDATVSVPSGGPRVDPDTLTTIAAAIRDQHRLRFDYRTHEGTETSYRTIEPHRLVHHGRRWYLTGWDVDREDWRTYRVDRLTPRIPTGPRFTPREAPDAADQVSRGVTSAPYRYRARITLLTSADRAADVISPTVGVLEAVDANTCVLHAGANSLDAIAVYVAGFGFEFRVIEPPELVDRMRELSTLLSRAAGDG